MQEVGYAALQIVPSFKGLDRNLEQGTSGAMVTAGTRGGAKFGDSAGRSAGRRFGSVFRTVAGASIAGIGALGYGAFKLGKDAVEKASDLNESLNAVNVTYGKQAKAVRELGSEAADALGLSNSEFNGLAVQFSAFATQVAGGEGPKVVRVLDDLATRGADFASVMNLEVNEAMGLFQSGLAGETEPLRKFGIDLSAAKVESYAYAKGIAKQGKELTEAQKVQARYGSLMEQTNKTAGDFANTSDSLANRQRILNARWDDAQAKLGTALLPVMEDVAGFLLKEGIPAFEKASDWFVKDGIPAISGFVDDMKPLALEIGPAAADVLGMMRDAASDAAPFVKDLVGFFNDLPSEAKLAAVGGALGGYGALKLRSGSGALGGVGSALGMSKPVPVFVTNQGFAGAAGGGRGGSTVAATTGGKSGRGAVAKGTAVGIFASIFGDDLINEIGAELDFARNRINQGTFHPSTTKLPQNAAGNLHGADALASLNLGPLGKDLDNVTGKARLMGDTWIAAEDKVRGSTRNMIRGVGNFDTEIAKLPKKVITEITAPGADFSRKQAVALARQYELTPKEKRTLFRVLDVDRSKSSTQQLQDVLARTPRNVNTSVTVSGVSQARAEVDGLIGALNNVASAASNAIDRAGQVAIGGSRGRTRYP